jgi:hypothetical protein
MVGPGSRPRIVKDWPSGPPAPSVAFLFAPHITDVTRRLGVILAAYNPAIRSNGRKRLSLHQPRSNMGMTNLAAIFYEFMHFTVRLRTRRGNSEISDRPQFGFGG